MEGVPGAVPTSSREPLHPASAISAGWSAYKTDWLRHSLFMLGAVALYCVAAFIPFLNLLVGLLVAPAYIAGIYAFGLRTLRGQKPPFGSFFDGFQRWPTVTGALLLVQLAVMVMVAPLVITVMLTAGLAGATGAFRHNDPSALVKIFSVPIVLVAIVVLVVVYWWTIRTSLTAFLVMEQEQPDAIGAIKTSFALTRGSAWRLVGFGLLGVLCIMLGAIACGVGYFVALPAVLFGFANVFEQLRTRAGLAAGTLSRPRAA